MASLTIPDIVTYADELVSGVTNSYNSFSSLDEADSYHTRRLGNNAFVMADIATRTSALYWATDILNRQMWIGTPESSIQKLAWPRKYVPTRNTINLEATSSRRRSRHERDENLTLFSQWQDSTLIPEFVKDATAELALYLIERYEAGNTTVSQYDDSLANLTLGGLSLQPRENADYLTDMPYQVHFIVSDFLKSVKESDPSISLVRTVNLTRR
jgi:hypothetical protein